MNDRFLGDAASQDPAHQPQWQPQPQPAQPQQQWQQPPAQPQQQWQQPPAQPQQQWQQPSPQPWAPAAPQPYPVQQSYPVQQPTGQAYPGQAYPGQPYPGQQPAAQWPPTAPAKPRSKKGLLVAAGAVVVVGAIGVTLALVLPGDATSAAQTVPRVVDIATKPTSAWTHDMLDDDDVDSDYVYPGVPVAVGDDLALVWSTFDSYSWGMEQSESSGWYEDFDAHYDLGVVDGNAYLAAEKAAEQVFEDDWSAAVDWPEYEDFWPADFVGEWYDYDFQYLGYYAGFEDIVYGGDEGDSRIPAPEVVDFVPSVTLLDVTDGQERWTVDLVSVEPEVDHTWYVSAVSLDGGATIAVSMASGWDDMNAEQGTTIGTLDASDGSVISTTTVDGMASVYGFESALLVVSESGEDDELVLSRLDPTSLDSDPLWENEMDPMAYLSDFAAGQVRVTDDDGVEVLSTLDGTTVWEGDRLLSVGTSVLSLEGDEDSSTYALEVITEDGASEWEEPLEVAIAWSVDGYLFTAAKGSDDDYGEASYRKIQRVNPATGEELWDSAAKEVSYIVGVHDASVVAIADGRLVLLDLKTGEEKASYKIKDADSGVESWLGTENVYIAAGGSLLAYSLADDGKQWSYGIDDDAYVGEIGRHLTVRNTESGELSGLGVE